MSEYIKKLKRQIEIIGLALSKYQTYSIADLAFLYGVEELTIKRDLSGIRSRGIDIHSTKKQGIKIYNPISPDLLKEFILEYISFSYSEDYPDKSTNILIKKHGEKSLSFIVDLQRAIENFNIVNIDYQQTSTTIKKNIEICPIKIFQAQNEWRVLALNEQIIKQYLISKLIDLRLTQRKFSPISKEKLNYIFSSSLKSWIGPEQFYIKILFEKNWAEVISNKTYLLNQSITEQSDGSVVFEGIVNSLDEAETWILSFGKGVKVLQPEELKTRVINLAKDALSNYSL